MSAELVDITVKFAIGGTKAKVNDVKLQLGKASTVGHLRAFLSFEESTKYYTSYDLFENNRLVSDDESVEELIGGGSQLTFQFKPKAYNQTTAFQHFLTLRESLGFSSELEDDISQFAISSGSQFPDMKLEPKDQKENSGEEKSKFEAICNELLSSTEVAFNPASLKTSNLLVTPILRSLNFSNYNPVPPFYKTKGHLLYLQVVTLENETFHISATASGFYVNKSSSIKFDPSPREEFEVRFNLIDLLGLISKKFNSHFSALKAKLSSTDNAQYVKPISAFLSKPWLVSQLSSNNGDYTRLQLPYFNNDDERNFTDEFQATKDIEINSPYDRLKSEKMTARLLHEFNTDAVKGAMAIVNNELSPIDPSTTGENAVYFYNSLIFSFVTDATSNFEEIGGNEAAHAASNQDLQIVNHLNRLGLKSVRHCLTAIIDYAGYRILVQSPVPGLLTPTGVRVSVDEDGREIAEPIEPLISVNYGLDEMSQTFKFDQSISDSVDEFAKNFYLKTHKVQDHDFKLSSKSKGIFGVDQRPYIIDLANTNPLDVRFVKENYDAVTEDQYPHRQTLIRRELVEKWRLSKLETSGQTLEEAFEKNEFSYNPDAYVEEGVEDESVLEISDYLNDTVIPAILNDLIRGNSNLPYDGQHLTSLLHTNGINMRYLGKIIDLVKIEYEEQKKARYAHLEKVKSDNKEYEEWEAQYLAKVEKLIKERQAQISEYVKEGKEVPKELQENIKLDESELRAPTKSEGHTVEVDQYEGLVAVCELEIVSRSLKHILRRESKKLQSPFLVPHLVTFILNLLFGSDYNPEVTVEDLDPFYSSKDLEFTRFTRESLITEIATEAKLRFRHKISCEWFASYEQQYSNFALIRAICEKFGVQLLNKEYFFSKDQYESWKQAQDKKFRSKLTDPKQTFSINDFSLRPLIKGSDFQSLVSEELWIQGATMLNAISQEQDEEDSQENKKEEETTSEKQAEENESKLDDKKSAKRQERMEEALSLMAQSIAFREDIYGLVHPSLVSSYLLLSTMYSRLSQLDQAIVFCNKAALLSERCFGVDSFETVRILSNLAYLELSQGSVYNAAVVLKKVNELLKLLAPSIHSSRINIFNLLYQVGSSIDDKKLEVKILNKFSELLLKVTGGDETLPYGQNESRLSNLYASMDDMHHALEHLSKAKAVFVNELGMNDETTVRSKQWIEGIESIIVKQQQKKKLAQANQQAKVTESSKKGGKKPIQSNPDLANKSVDELLQFIEGSSSESKPKASKKSKKKSAKK